MRIFTETYMTRRTFEDEPRRRSTIQTARWAAANHGFRGRVSFTWRNAGHAGDLIAIRIWA